MATSTDTRQRFLETTARLLQARGYAGTSLTEIIAESGAPRGSLYYHFPGGKEELVREATIHSVDYVNEFLRTCFAADQDPVAAVRRYAGEAARELSESDFVFGCPVAPLVLDGVEQQELGRICRDAMESWQEMIAERLLREGLEAARARSFASVLVSAIEGALLVARALRDTKPLEQVGAELATHLHDLLEEKGPRNEPADSRDSC